MARGTNKRVTALKLARQRIETGVSSFACVALSSVGAHRSDLRSTCRDLRHEIENAIAPLRYVSSWAAWYGVRAEGDEDEFWRAYRLAWLDHWIAYEESR